MTHAMASDLRALIATELRQHPRVAFQHLLDGRDFVAKLADELPVLPPFRQSFVGAIAIVDWDHRLPSRAMTLRLNGYYTPAMLSAGEQNYERRLETIALRDRYPEFDVVDFGDLIADEAYQIALSIGGEVGECRLTSSWRRNISADDDQAAVEIVRASSDFEEVRRSCGTRPPHLGDLEAVSWTPPCESQHAAWTLDVWFLLRFDGRMGTGRSFLVDLETQRVVVTREFSVRGR